MTLQQLLAEVDATTAELVSLHQDLIRFPTVNTGRMPTGHETPCAQYLADLLAADGVAAEVFEGGPDRGNLLARLPGHGSGRSLLLMSHLDVVPPGDESRWTHGPFEGDLVEGWVFGRGSQDCKGLTAPQVHALRLLARHGVTLGGDLKLAACADEETGGRYGFGAVAAHRPEALQADLAINEGGGAPVRLADGTPARLVAVAEKGRLEAHLTITGRSEHASVPWLAENPLDQLATILRRLREHRPEPLLTPVAQELAERLWGVTVADVDALERLVAARLTSDPGDAARLLALSRMTLEPTMVQAGVKSNAIPDLAELVLDVRTLPGQTPGDVQGELARVLRRLVGVTVDLQETSAPDATSWTPDWAAVLQGALAAMDPDSPVVLPTWCTGFTDSRHVRPLGVPVFGFGPLPGATDVNRCGCHNLDEQFPVAGLVYRAKFFLALAWAVCGQAA